MKIYEVGGCVRDRLMGKEPKDIDFVVVGSSEEEMKSLGYMQVGKDFPVFLNPKDNCEYALARTERKTGTGYNGFTVKSDGVTLEEDLFRRDLTMNAMAMDKDGNITDPYGGQKDIKDKLIRHVSVHFAEDPLRVLRAARFAARYEFSIAKETVKLMQDLAESGELSALVKERVWAETIKVIEGGGNPTIYFKCLMETNALKPVYKIESVELERMNKVVSSNMNADDKLKMIYLLVYSNPDVIAKIDSFPTNQINWEEYSKKGKPVLYANREMYAPSVYTRIRDQFGAVVNFGEYDTKSANERLQMIKILRASQNKDTVSFMYDAIIQLTKNEDVVESAQRSKAEFLSDVELLDRLDYETIRKNCAPKEISVKMEEAQLIALEEKIASKNLQLRKLKI